MTSNTKEARTIADLAKTMEMNRAQKMQLVMVEGNPFVNEINPPCSLEGVKKEWVDVILNRQKYVHESAEGEALPQMNVSFSADKDQNEIDSPNQPAGINEEWIDADTAAKQVEVNEPNDGNLNRQKYEYKLTKVEAVQQMDVSFGAGKAQNEIDSPNQPADETTRNEENTSRANPESGFRNINAAPLAAEFNKELALRILGKL